MKLGNAVYKKIAIWDLLANVIHIQKNHMSQVVPFVPGLQFSH